MDFPICGAEILKLIPQRHPMLMISELLRSSSIEAFTSFCIEEDCIFVENRNLSPYGIIENIAQSAAAMNGFNNYKDGIPPRLGFIGEIKDFRVFSLPPSQHTIITHVAIIAETNNVSLIEGKVFLKNTETEAIAQTKLKISIQNA